MWKTQALGYIIIEIYWLREKERGSVSRVSEWKSHVVINSEFVKGVCVFNRSVCTLNLGLVCEIVQEYCDI